MTGLRHVGTIAPYLAAAFAPDGATLYVNHDGSGIVAYTYPALTVISTVVTPASSGGLIEGIACDDAEVLYWWELTASFGIRLYKDQSSPTSFYDTVDERGPVGLCWSPYDSLLYGFGLTDIVDGECLCSWDPTIAGGDRTVLFTPPGVNDDLKFVNNPVPTLDGGIWWSYPDVPASSSSIHRYDIPGAAGDTADFALDDVFIPRPDGFAWGYGTPRVGGVGAAGYFFYTDASFDWPLAVLDGFSPGPRATAYTPTLGRVCFERGSSGEVWTISEGGWMVGRVRWPTAIPG